MTILNYVHEWKMFLLLHSIRSYRRTTRIPLLFPFCAFSVLHPQEKKMVAMQVPFFAPPAAAHEKKEDEARTPRAPAGGRSPIGANLSRTAPPQGRGQAPSLPYYGFAGRYVVGYAKRLRPTCRGHVSNATLAVALVLKFAPMGRSPPAPPAE